MPCIQPGAGTVVRFTKLNQCCAPVDDQCGTVTSDTVSSIEMSPQTEDTDEVRQTNIAGDVCLLRPSRSQISNIELTIEFCQVNTDIYELTTGNAPMLDWQGNSNGFRINNKFLDSSAWAMELWIAAEGPGQCEAGTEGTWLYMLFPCIQAGVPGDVTVTDGEAITFSITSRTRSGEAWCQGPYDVIEQDANGTPGRLIEPLQDGDHMVALLTSVPPPDPHCECIPLTLPDPYCPEESPAA